MTGLVIRPAAEASWAELQTVLGETGYTAKCQCQHYKIRDSHWASVSDADRAARFREQTGCGHPEARFTSGLVAFLDDQPVGWCAVEPRSAYPRLLYTRVPWSGRTEDKADDSVWAVTCFLTRKGFRRRGVSYALAGATVDFARARGARALEAYPIITQRGQEITWDEMRVGNRSIFLDAGFTEIHRPSLRRVVMRIDF